MRGEILPTDCTDIHKFKIKIENWRRSSISEYDLFSFINLAMNIITQLAMMVVGLLIPKQPEFSGKNRLLRDKQRYHYAT